MGAALWWLMPQIAPMFTGSIATKALGIGAILAAGALTYGPAAFLLGVLDKRTAQRLMRGQT